ncbi:MAG: aspartate-semialdehyde dehydrogenase [Rhodospirillaceae bacterium]|jgi:aspartate-semialdehyde dehydrogenase|nr:aspartate-semialdehyde dehydrogenase [Rhodospirillaceae bacterium]
MGYRVAIVGATGNVGSKIIQILDERKFPVDELIALTSERSVGREISFGNDKILKAKDLSKFDFNGIDIVLSSPGAKVSAIYSPRAVTDGCVVIDNTSHFRMDSDVPLVVPEVNPQAIASVGYKRSGIIANPNCSTIQMVLVLKPLHDVGKIKRVVVSTYQSVSGAGKGAMDELFNQTRAIYSNDQFKPDLFNKQIAFNIIPHIDVFMNNGSTKEEWKMEVETQKILDPKIAVHATCVRVPVFVSHGESVNVEFERPIGVTTARGILSKSPGVIVIDHRSDGGYITPIEATNEDAVYVSRIRNDPTVKNGLSFWCVSDNLRKGAALNAVQIAEVLIRDYLK